MSFEIYVYKKHKKEKMKSGSPDDPEEIREILNVVSTEVPALIKNIFSALYDPDIAGNFGKGIGSLYKELKEQGLPEDMITKIVLTFSESFNIVGKALDSDIIKQAREKDEE